MPSKGRNTYNPSTPTCGGKVGQLCSTKNGNGHTTAYHYDAAGNLDTVTPPAPLGATTITVDALGRPATVTDGKANKYGDSGGTVTYGYDAANELNLLKEPSLAQTTFGYNNDAVRTTTNYPGGTTMALTPDKSGRPQEIKATHISTVLSDFTYTYNQGSSDTSLVQTGTDTVAGRTTTYSYDGLNRLTNAVEKQGVTTTASGLYCYDNDGNPTSTSTAPGAACPGATSYTYNSIDELTKLNGVTTGWGYDANGNETKALGATTFTVETYSATNQLTSLKSGGVANPYTYTGLTNAERVTAGTTSYQTGEEGLANQTSGGATTSWTRDPGGTLISQRVRGQSITPLRRPR